MATIGIVPARGDLTAYRWVSFINSIPFIGFDLTGAVMTLQVRLYSDAPGAPLLNLNNDSGLAMTVATVGGLTTSTLRILIDAADINGLPSAGEIGEPSKFSYGLHLSCNAYDVKQRWLEGKFTVIPGANQA